MKRLTRPILLFLKSLLPRRLLRLGIKLLPKRWVVPLVEFGHPIKFVLYPKQGEDFGVLGHHELEVRKILPRILRAGDIAIDIGAHHGLYTLLMAILVKENGVVHAFDPHPHNIQRIVENVAINQLQNVVVNQIAISDVSGKSLFNFGNSPKVSSLKAIDGQREDWHEVETTSLDDYWHKSGKPDIKLIKIDVEGAEDLVLRGMVDVLSECRPAILLELHLFVLSAAEISDLLSFLFSRRYSGRVMYIVDLGSKYRNVPDHPPITTYSALEEMSEQAHTVGLIFQHAA